MNEPDYAERRTDSTDYRLKIKYASGEKEIITSNTVKDSPKVDAILRVFEKLQNQLEFKEINTTQ